MIDRTRERLCAVAAVAALLLAGASAAQAGPQEDAAAISQGIEGFLSLVSNQSQAVGVSHDKVTVSSDGSGFAVAITGMRLGSGAAGLNLGEIDYRVEPQSAGVYKVSDLKLAHEMPVVDDGGKPAGTLSFQTTAFSGLWSSALQSFLALDWRTKDIVATSREEPKAVFRVAQAALNADGKDAGGGRLDETVTYTLTDVSVTDPNGDAFKAAKLGGRMVLHAFDFPGYRAQMARLHDLAQRYTASGAPSLTDADRAEIADVAKALPTLVAGTDLDLTVDDASAGADGSVKHGELGIALTGMSGDAATIRFHLQQEALAIDDPDMSGPLSDALLPRSMDLNFSLDQVPLVSATQSLAQAMTSGGAMAQDPGSLLLMTMMSAVGSAPLAMTIAPSSIDTARGHFTFDGNLADAGGMPTGTVHLTATGLAEVLRPIEAELQKDPDGKGLLDQLHAVQGSAEHATGADGKPVDKFLLELGADGQMRINGKPIDLF
jgi:hypothetical protein